MNKISIDAKQILLGKGFKGMRPNRDFNLAIISMQEYGRQIAIAVRKECAVKACLDLGEGREAVKSYEVRTDLLEEFGITVQQDSILNVDIEQFIK